jgi:gliding motility-associated-like protein
LTNGTATAIASGGTPGYTYLWNTTATTDTISGLGANTFFVTVKDTLGCIATGSVVIAQPASAVSVSIAHTDVTCRGLSNGTAQATAAGGTSGYTYLWNNGQTSSSLTNLSAGPDTVTVTDANGCKASATVVIAPSNDTLTIDTAATAATCGLANGTVKVIPTGGSGTYQYLWSNNATSATVSGLSGGTYDVVVTDNTGCSGTKSVSIAQLPAISATVTTRNDSCAQQIGSAAISIDNGHAPYSYTWIPAGTDPTKLDSGSYSVTITDSLGCVTAASFIIENINNGCNSIILFPTGFTPNGDGKNETFHAVYTPDLNRFQMRIYDRWGQLVFETDDYTDGWDGTFKNVAQPIGVYIWFAEYSFGNKPTQAKTGNITLLR